MYAEKDDVARAEKIRDLFSQLSAEINAAKDSGLKIELNNLHTLGTPNWIGYRDVAKITREF